MQLTRAADYAVRVMIHLAGLPPGTRANRSELAAAADCPEQFLSKVLQSLTRAGLIASHRGNCGGFEFPQNRPEVTVLEVVEAIEGPVRLNLCLNPDETCARKATCPAHPVWEEAQKAMVAVLHKASVNGLAKQAAAAKPAPTLIEGPQWS